MNDATDPGHHARGLRGGRTALRALYEAAPEALARFTSFRGILLVHAAGADPLELAERVRRAAGERIGRVMAVFAETPSEETSIRAAAAVRGAHCIGPDESFCFRLHKRGTHSIQRASHLVERDIGAAIWEALRERDGREPRVDLERPDVVLSAELLGPRALLCLQRSSWQTPPACAARERARR